MRRERDVPRCLFVANVNRTLIPLDARATHDAVEAAIPGFHPVVVPARAELRAAPLATGAAHLEDIGVVGGEFVHDRQPHRVRGVVDEPQPLVQHAVPEKPRPIDVDDVARQLHGAAGDDVRVREIRAEHRVVGVRAGTEQQRPVVTETQPQERQESRALVVESLLAEAGADDVAERVEDRERVPLLEHPALLVGRRRGRQDVIGVHLLRRAGQLTPMLLPSERRLLEDSLLLLPTSPGSKDDVKQTTQNKTS